MELADGELDLIDSKLAPPGTFALWLRHPNSYLSRTARTQIANRGQGGPRQLVRRDGVRDGDEAFV